MKKIFSIFPILLFAVLVFNCSEEKSNYVAVSKFDPNRNAEADIQDAVAEAERTDKRIILDVGGEWCIWCHRIDQFIDENKELKDFLNEHYLVVKINYSKENKNEELLSNYPEIEGYPHFFVLESDGTLLHSQNTGDLEKEKSYDIDKFMTFLKEWMRG